MEGLGEVLSIFSMYDIAVLIAAMITVAKLNPIFEERCKYPKVWGIVAPFGVSFLGLLTLWAMKEHTLPEVLFLSFVYGGGGDWLFHRYAAVKRVANGTG